MSTSLMYHTQRISGFQHSNFKYPNSKVIERIKRKSFQCRKCSSSNITIKRRRTRLIQGLPYGLKKTYFEVDIHHLYCRKCKCRQLEQLPFISHPKSRITKAMERTIIELRAEMSISAIAKYLGVDWRIVKATEKRYLKKKFKKIKLKNIKTIGIDEIYVSRKKDQGKFISIVRDLESGAVLHVGKGKGAEALAPFGAKLKRAKCNIEIITMDMSAAFIAWVKDNLPNAETVFDHFHVIKLMNDKLDKVRRRITATLDDEHKRLLKNQRFLFLRNVEKLEPDAKLLLDNLRQTFKELGDASMLKEALRSIYRKAENDTQAEAALRNWCSIARQTEVNELVQMAKTIEKHMRGITAFWRTDGLSNAPMEGFNNKIRWLMRQAYGYRDEEYFHWKIFDLPNLKTKKQL
jgi:transposase